MEWSKRVVAHTPEKILEHLAGIRKNWLAFPGNAEPTRLGFVTIIVEDVTGILVLPPIFEGEIPVDKRVIYLYYATEKVIRLGEHLTHVTSRASADPDAMQKPATDRKFGGAVRSPRFLRVGTSGLPWNGDQGVGAALLDRMGLLDDGLLGEIERESGDTLTRAFVLFDREHRS